MIKLDSTDYETICEALRELRRHAKEQKTLCHCAPMQEDYERQETEATITLEKLAQAGYS